MLEIVLYSYVEVEECGTPCALALQLVLKLHCLTVESCWHQSMDWLWGQFDLF